jgi:hypothetical protein
MSPFSQCLRIFQYWNQTFLLTIDNNLRLNHSGSFMFFRMQNVSIIVQIIFNDLVNSWTAYTNDVWNLWNRFSSWSRWMNFSKSQFNDSEFHMKRNISSCFHFFLNLSNCKIGNFRFWFKQISVIFVVLHFFMI